MIRRNEGRRATVLVAGAAGGYLAAQVLFAILNAAATAATPAGVPHHAPISGGLAHALGLLLALAVVVGALSKGKL